MRIMVVQERLGCQYSSENRLLSKKLEWDLPREAIEKVP